MIISAAAKSGQPSQEAVGGDAAVHDANRSHITVKSLEHVPQQY